MEVDLHIPGTNDYAHTSATVSMVESIICDEKRVLPCAAYLQGEYGYNNLYIGVPVVLGAMVSICLAAVTRNPDAA